MLSNLRSKVSDRLGHEFYATKNLNNTAKNATASGENAAPQPVGQTKGQTSTRRKWFAVAAAYVAWRAGFAVAVSPLGFKILTAQQMGFMLGTLPMGFLVAAVILALGTGVSLTNAQVDAYAKGFSHVKTREQFDTAWSTTLRGADDGFISESYWSGAILPLFILVFTLIGIPFLISAALAIVSRIFLHIGTHAIFPQEEYGERAFGGWGFISRGIAMQDTMNCVAFLVSGNVIAPILLHHLSAYIPTWFGVKEKVAKKLGFNPLLSNKKPTNP